MGDPVAGQMESDGDDSRFNDNKAMEIAGKEEKNRTPPSPEEEDVLIDQKLFFSDEDAFPSLADFACLSSPSPASTLPMPSNSSPSSSSSLSSSSPWPFLLGHTETDGAHPPAADAATDDPLVPITDGGFDIFGDEIDLFETCTEEPVESKWYASSSFSGETAAEEKVGFLCGGEGCSSEDSASVFLDWLKRNKDSISPEDLRSIRLKRSTVESAARRLGGGKQGRVQLLKLILNWVQKHHLQKRRRCSRGSEASGTYQDLPNYPLLPPQIATTPNVDLSSHAGPCNSWMPYTVEHSYHNDQAFSAQPWQQGLPLASSTPPMIYYSQMPPPAPAELAQAPTQYLQHLPVYYAGQMASATREARKKRMARHRKCPSLHRSRNQTEQSQLQQSHDTVVAADESSSAPSDVKKDNFSRNSSLFSYFSADIPSSSSLAAAQAKSPLALAAQRQEEHHRRRRNTFSPGESRRPEGIKSENNNYKFLLRKVLKQSDVGSLGRIVLPKKDAEIHLPALDTRDGISIEMEDMGASRVWNMRYRFWPNDKSRMYVLENTGDFVRTNGLQQGDFIVIYSDVKCEKYMIRGVKVRQPMDLLKGASNRSSGKAHQRKENGGATIDEKGKSYCSDEYSLVK